MNDGWFNRRARHDFYALFHPPPTFPATKVRILMRSRTVDVTTKLPPLLDCRLMACEKIEVKFGMNDGWFNRRARTRLLRTFSPPLLFPRPKSEY